MEQFSGKLSVRLSEAIFVDEFSLVFQNQPLGRNIAYAHFIDAFAFRTRLESTFPEGMDEDEMRRSANSATELVEERFKTIRISDVINAELDKRTPGFTGLNTEWEQLCREIQDERRNNPKLTRLDVEHAEFAATERWLIRIYDWANPDKTNLKKIPHNVQRSKKGTAPKMSCLLVFIQVVCCSTQQSTANAKRLLGSAGGKSCALS